MHAAPHAAAVLIIATAPMALGWTSISQTLGVSLDQVRSTLGGDDSTANFKADQLLGYLWTLPLDDTDTRGLGGGITYAWDPGLCEQLVPAFREDFPIFIDCRALRSGIHRAFNAWQDLHSTIKFHDVTEICDNSNSNITMDENGTRSSDCPYKEVFITWMGDASRVALGVPADAMALMERTKTELSTDFQYTNGERPHYVDGSGTTHYRQVLEVLEATISFDAGKCWYMDTHFCDTWHTLKDSMGESTAWWLGTMVMVSAWLTGMLLICGKFFLIVREQLKIIRDDLKELKEDLEHAADRGLSANLSELTSGKDHKTFKQRCDVALEILSGWSTLGIALRLMLCILPPLYYKQIFIVCWSCYDFQAAAVHQIGHMLGMGHPGETIGDPSLPNGTIPIDSYNGAFLDGTPMDDTQCTQPWAQVALGLGATRSAAMESLTRHNPSACLTQDDLEGFNTLYPECHGQLTVAPSSCYQVSLNIGLLRFGLFVIIPTVIAKIFSMILGYLIERRENGKLAEKMKKLKEEQEEHSVHEHEVLAGKAKYHVKALLMQQKAEAMNRQAELMLAKEVKGKSGVELGRKLQAKSNPNAKMLQVVAKMQGGQNEADGGRADLLYGGNPFLVAARKNADQAKKTKKYADVFNRLSAQTQGRSSVAESKGGAWAKRAKAATAAKTPMKPPEDKGGLSEAGPSAEPGLSGRHSRCAPTMLIHGVEASDRANARPALWTVAKTPARPAPGWSAPGSNEMASTAKAL